MRQALILLALLSFALPAAAQEYRGKQIRMVIASGAGGGYDLYGRVLARWLAKHIPGEPVVVSQNMPGASGMNATNWAYVSAPKDGTVILATYNADIVEPLFGNKSAKYKSRDFAWIGSIGKQQNICMTWHTSPVKSIEDAKKREVLVAATGSTGNSATLPRIVNAMLGTKFKVIGGYETTESRLAVERGEVEGICGLSWSTLKASNPEWTQSHRMNVLVQTGTPRHPELPDVPLLRELTKNPEDLRMLDLLEIPETMGRPFLMPPGTPPALVATIRAAFDATMIDKDFLAEAEKAHLEIDPIDGATMQKQIEQAYAAPQALIERAASFVEGAKE
jgi:tripartite-type tricarboxylate transporter receptor subunit TctC